MVVNLQIDRQTVATAVLPDLYTLLLQRKRSVVDLGLA
jgi:hypothetical protein